MRSSFVRLVLLCLALARAAHAQERPSFAIRDVRVFDGERVIPRATVVVADGTIRAVGPRVTVPAGTRVVEGAGRTLLPGLIDAHVHAFGTAPRSALMFGVTTELDMFTSYQQARRWRDEQASTGAPGRADVFSAGTIVTVPGGHGTEYGLAIPTVSDTTDAQAFIDARIAEGSAWIKLVYDGGGAYGLRYPTLTATQLGALIAAAHRRGKLAVVHISALQGAREALEAGGDGLAHLFTDRAPDPEFGRLVRERLAFVIPTLSVLESVAGTPGGASLAVDSLLSPYLSVDDVGTLRRPFPARPGTTSSLEHAFEAVRQLRAVGVRLLAGTDAPNPGTAHGASLHRELELLVRAGLTPVEALTAATSAPAAAFRLAAVGRVAPGFRADLVLVDGDPTADITATRRVVAIWKLGVEADRAGFRRELAEAVRARPLAQLGPAGAEPGLVSDFNDGTAAVRFGSGWVLSSDSMMGGGSWSRYEIVSGGALGSPGAMAVRGVIAAGTPVWAGVMFLPGSYSFAPADLSAHAAIRFWTRGDGSAYDVMVFSRASGSLPVARSFTAGPDWTEVTVPWAEFPRVDPRGVQAILFAAGQRPGSFAFQIDEVRVR